MDFEIEFIGKLLSYSITVACVQIVLNLLSARSSDLDLNNQGYLRITMKKYVKTFHVMGIVYLGITLLVSMIPQENQQLAKIVLTVMAFVGGIVFLH